MTFVNIRHNNSLKNKDQMLSTVTLVVFFPKFKVQFRVMAMQVPKTKDLPTHTSMTSVTLTSKT